MPSKREREYARRRYQKQAARAARTARLRRERLLVVTFTVIGFAALVAALLLANRNEQPQAGETPTDIAPTDTATDPAALEPLPTTNPEQYEAAPPASDALAQDWNVTMTTNVGDITMVLHGADAPQAVANFVFLANNGYFDGTACHRLMPDALLQCGDPTATGQGGPGYSWGPIENAPEDGVYPAGTVAMARVGGDGESMGSQFFLVFADVPLPADAAGGYSVFGEITGGLEILQQIGAGGVDPNSVGQDGTGRPATDVIITTVEVE
ncbi:peptidylprolyl isomerase [Pseudactinotalea terrae]|uniref:peptidylprolyl isomerase n=1 Tax=Pseudactinotalea terrae TaxID=1743262 RepID=UPI0012E1B342|nr:peptidylprolyl isomerase [Pseudactinotalea terrae]